MAVRLAPPPWEYASWGPCHGAPAGPPSTGTHVQAALPPPPLRLQLAGTCAPPTHWAASRADAEVSLSPPAPPGPHRLWVAAIVCGGAGVGWRDARVLRAGWVKGPGWGGGLFGGEGGVAVAGVAPPLGRAVGPKRRRITARGPRTGSSLGSCVVRTFHHSIQAAGREPCEVAGPKGRPAPACQRRWGGWLLLTLSLLLFDITVGGERCCHCCKTPRRHARDTRPGRLPPNTFFQNQHLSSTVCLVPPMVGV